MAITVLVVFAMNGAAAIGPVSAGVTSGITPSNPAEPSESAQLAQLRQRVNELRASLTGATARYEATQNRLRTDRLQAEKAARRAVAAGTRLSAARSAFDDYASSVYRGAGSDQLTALMNYGGDPAQLITALGYLDEVARSQADAVNEMRVSRLDAAEADAEAAQSVRRANADAADAARELTGLRRQAAQADAELTKLWQKILAERAARARAARAAAVRAAALRAAARQAESRKAAARKAAAQAGVASAAIHAAASPQSIAALTGCAPRVFGPPPVNPSWGGFANGFIPVDALCEISVPGQRLRRDAAAAFERLNAAHRTTFGEPMCVTDSYRDFATQVRLYQQKPGLAAVPGTSNHGWALAVDLCGGAESFGTPADLWLRANAGRYGWVHPAWAEPYSLRAEPWHWEYGRIS